MTLSLPTSGRISTDDLTAALREASAFLGEPAAIEVRTAAVLGDGRWFNFHTVLRARRARHRVPDRDFRVGDAWLLSWWHEPEAMKSPDMLRQALAGWRLKTGVPSGYGIQSTTNVDRHGAFGPYAERPCWVCSVHEQVEGEDAMAPPRGPFFNAAEDIVAPTAQALAAEWLRDDSLHQQPAACNSYRVILPDLRAWLSSLEADGNELAVDVRGHYRGDLRVAAVRLGFRGESQKLIAPVGNGRARLEFSGGVRDLDLWVITPDGLWLDHYHEDAHRVSWGASLYNRPPEQRKDYADIDAALEAGEDEHIEFKEWVNVQQRDNKTPELLQVACSFANAKGGAIYIGITDAGEVVGTDRRLRDDYAPIEKKPLEQLRDAYVRDVKKFLNEGVRPSVNPEFEWLESAGLVVLKVSIREGTERPYSLVENGDIYVRRGATSRKARASDYSDGLRRAF